MSNKPDRPPFPWEQEPTGIPKPGLITWSEQWPMTDAIRGLLEQLAQYGVNTYSSRGDNDFTFMVPPHLHPGQNEVVEELMKKVSKKVRRKLEYIDWYPHGWKWRIDLPKK